MPNGALEVGEEEGLKVKNEKRKVKSR